MSAVGKPRRRPPNSFRFVSRSGSPILVTANRPAYSIGIQGFSPTLHQTLSGPLVAAPSARSYPRLMGGPVLAQHRPFAAVAPPSAATGDSGAFTPFFYVDRPGEIDTKLATDSGGSDGATQFNGHNTFLVERTQHAVKNGWVPPNVEFGRIDAVPVMPGPPPQLQLLATGNVVRVPVDPVDSLSIMALTVPADWATEPERVLVISGRHVGVGGRVPVNSVARGSSLRDGEV